MELRGSDVLVRAQVVLYGRQVHRLLYDLAVVRNAQCDWVYGLPEEPRGAGVLEQVEYAYAGA